MLSKMCVCLHVKYLLSCQIFTKLKFYGQIFKNTRNVKFYENPFNGNNFGFLEDRQMDKHDEANSHFSQFCECA